MKRAGDTGKGEGKRRSRRSLRAPEFPIFPLSFPFPVFSPFSRHFSTEGASAEEKDKARCLVD